MTSSTFVITETLRSSTLRLPHIYQFSNVTLNISEGETLALQVLTILGLVLSILGLLATVIGLAVFRLVHDVIYYMCTDTVLFITCALSYLLHDVH